VIAIFSQARRFHRQTLVKSERNNQAIRNVYGSFLEEPQSKRHERLPMSISSLSPRSPTFRSNDSLLINNDDSSSWDFDEYQRKKIKEAITDWGNQRTLLLWFGITMIPFIIVSVIDTILKGKTHLLPSISAEECDMSSTPMEVMTILIWIIIHITEASVFAYYYRKLRTVLKEFHTQQEFALIFAGEIIYTTIFVALLASITHLDTSNINHAVDFVVMSRSALFTCISILWPTYSTYFGTQAPKFPNRSVLKSLRNVLEDPLALNYFYNYLRNDETSLTLLQFWMEVDMFRENAYDIEEMAVPRDDSSARKLFHNYFQSNTEELQILKMKPESQKNREVMMRIIPRKIVNDMLGEIKRCEHGELPYRDDLFEDAKLIAFKNLETVYHLFLRSKECKDLLYHLNGEELLFKTLIESKVI